MQSQSTEVDTGCGQDQFTKTPKSVTQIRETRERRIKKPLAESRNTNKSKPKAESVPSSLDMNPPDGCPNRASCLRDNPLTLGCVRRTFRRHPQTLIRRAPLPPKQMHPKPAPISKGLPLPRDTRRSGSPGSMQVWRITRSVP